MGDLPTGTVTFLFTDIEGSTERWDRFPVAMEAALARHDALVGAAVEDHGGHVFKTVGDAFCAAFPSAGSGLLAAINAQRAVAGEDWTAFGPDFPPIAVRMGRAAYPSGEELAEAVAELGGRVERVRLEGMDDPRMQNVALIGRLVALDLIENLDEAIVEQALRAAVPRKALDANLAVFQQALAGA
jgi:hypothetical protein